MDIMALLSRPVREGLCHNSKFKVKSSKLRCHNFEL